MVKNPSSNSRQTALAKARRDRFHARHPGYHHEMYLRHLEKRSQYLAENRASILVKRAAYRAEHKQRLNAALRTQRKAWPFWKKRFVKSLEKANRNGASVIAKPAIEAFYKRVFTQDAATCDYCRGVFAIREIVVDHKQPYALGGCHVVTNLAISCYACNRRKNSTPYDKWVSLQR